MQVCNEICMSIKQMGVQNRMFIKQMHLLFVLRISDVLLRLYVQPGKTKRTYKLNLKTQTHFNIIIIACFIDRYCLFHK